MKETAVYRQPALPVSVFDHIKDTQRAHEALTGAQLTINETVSLIIREHKQNVERGERTNEQANQQARVPALLR